MSTAIRYPRLKSGSRYDDCAILPPKRTNERRSAWCWRARSLEWRACGRSEVSGRPIDVLRSWPKRFGLVAVLVRKIARWLLMDIGLWGNRYVTDASSRDRIVSVLYLQALYQLISYVSRDSKENCGVRPQQNSPARLPHVFRDQSQQSSGKAATDPCDRIFPPPPSIRGFYSIHRKWGEVGEVSYLWKHDILHGRQLRKEEPSELPQPRVGDGVRDVCHPACGA